MVGESSKLLSSNFADFNTKVQTAALGATRAAAGLPLDLKFHRSIDAELADDIDAFSSRVLAFTNNLLAAVSTSRSKGKTKLRNQDDVVDDFHSLVVDSMDQLLERTDMCLDEFQGKNKAPQIAINMNVDALRKPKPSKGALDSAVQHAANLPKPQLRFKHPINNSNDSPWYPALSHKFNAQVPLGHVFSDTEGDSIIRHPYRYEIMNIPYPLRMFLKAEPISPQSFDGTTATWVATAGALEAMIEELRHAAEVAIDLEHNNYRSFAGIVCLMQISTRSKDWIVDTLELRAELADGALNEVFTDPSIVKVFHGAESDIIWLQQDFNLYVVNLFDTYHASKLLEFPRHGLANLLETYCDFTPDKRYQLADWRVRPLPQEMLDYARSDTHFLLYIYDNLRNALFGSSQETALRTYEKEVYDADRGSGPGGWNSLAKKWNKGALLAAAELPNGKEILQRAVYRCVHQWRDSVARQEDESTRYILPNHFLFQLAESPPSDMTALLKTFSSVPPTVRKRAKELLDAIRTCVHSHLTRPQETMPAIEEKPVPIVEEDIVSKPSNEYVDPNVAPRSTLFGGVLSSESKSTSKATRSVLFGNRNIEKMVCGLKSTVGSSSFSVQPDLGFHDVVARIHSALVVAPSLPTVSPIEYPIPVKTDSWKIPQPAVAPALEETTGTGMQVEIPYLPASQRVTKPLAPVLDDSIVVVGQPRVKKRKRVKDRDADKKSPSVAESPPSKQDDEIVEPFDFGSVPNILDDAPTEEDTRVKKKRKNKKEKTEGKPFYGDFPAPPRAHREVKKGNQSRTFK
ncbi:Exosome complex exonuclease RRP6 [Mycena indigotica]|uniref:Exosome complex exonuclease RRP6 n=1 Tax=Mycena indigotica TaxID=2126181 RepID=A0A8H6SM27_9AGAR|nr:Exosome complex exonuclease RRP6 [Mycena indigotica]KAF7301136.1 Exosome complex exonuclease RRP6 [Mycena indigotica]